MNTLSSNDPIRMIQRRNTAARSKGVNAKCRKCGESRPEALIAGSKPMICAECQRKERGQSLTDNHHPFGKNNNPVIIPVPANDHRAELSVAQYEWPKKTRENPDGSPLLAAAGCIRGFIDTVLYLIQKGLQWIAGMLEKLDAFLVEQLGPKWWVSTPLEQFQSKT